MNSKGTKEPVAQKRGFYIALYCILAALLVLAAVISYNNYTAVKKARELRAQLETEDLQAANASQVESYLTQENQIANRTAPAPQATPAPAVPRVNRTTPIVTATPVPPPSAASPSSSRAPAADGQAQPPAASPAPAQSSDTAPAPARDNRSTEYAPPIVEVFTEGNTMRWPVLGEVVMDFSDNRLIYDRTLEQYRANKVLCIATDIGTPVQAATGGVVKNVGNSREHGNTIVIDHGNGWTTTYSQLQDGVLVKAGDVVTKGQVIGGVGSPSLYYVLLGNHLGFSVSREDVYLDPKLLLE